MEKDRVAIIGAGPSGLATGRILKLLNIPFKIYEKHSDVGGIWDRQNPGTPMYRSAHFISSKTMSGHIGFPMPENYPDYPSNQQILAYIRSFAKANNLYENIRLNTPVKVVTQKRDRWQVETAKGQKELYRWLVCASGTNWHPHRPNIKGEEDFKGEIIHSNVFDEPATLRDKRVLIVGAGNSGVDIACDAATNAKSAHISLRRGYHFVPKHLFGIPSDVFAKKTGGPMWLEQIVFSKLLRLLNGDLTRLGLTKPDHKVLSSHPIMNTQILHYLQHGDLTAHKDIDHLAGNTVHFVDGNSIEIDLIVLATGYHWHIPYLPEGIIEYHHERPRLYLNTFTAGNSTVFVNGFVETNSGAYRMFDDIAWLIGKTIAGQLHDHPDAGAVADLIQQPAPDLTGKINFVPSARHSNYTDSETFLKAVRKFCKKLGWQQVGDFLKDEKQKTG